MWLGGVAEDKCFGNQTWICVLAQIQFYNPENGIVIGVMMATRNFSPSVELLEGLFKG